MYHWDKKLQGLKQKISCWVIKSGSPGSWIRETEPPCSSHYTQRFSLPLITWLLPSQAFRNKLKIQKENQVSMLILSSFLTNKTIVNSCRCEKLHKREQNHKIVEDRSPTSSHADQERLSRCLVPGYLAGYSRTQGTLLPIKFFTHITVLSQMRPAARLPSFQSSF